MAFRKKRGWKSFSVSQFQLMLKGDNGTGANSGGPAAARATCAAGDQKADHQRAGASLGGGGTAGGGGEPGDSGVPGNRGSNDEARDEKTER